MATTETEQTEVTAEWEGPLALEGVITSDRRYLMPGEISERELPLTLMAMTVTDEGHKGAQVAGKITEIERIKNDDGSITIMGRGVFDKSEYGRETARMVSDQVLKGVSIDLATSEVIPLDAESLEPLEDMDLADLLLLDFVTGIKGQIMGATVCPFPAFEGASLDIVATSDGQVAVTAAAGIHLIEETPVTAIPLVPYSDGYTTTNASTIEITTSNSPFAARLPADTLIAAAVKAPVRPPREWFDDPNLKGPTPLTYTDDGRVYGHLALWDDCHTGYGNVCIQPFRSPSGFAYFNTGLMDCDQGSVACGKLMFSMDGGGHADINKAAAEAARHYDNATKVGAYVRAGADRYGIYLAGALRPGLTESELCHLKLHPPSGDWRPIKGASELIAAFSVPVPGFPIVQAQLVASAAGESVLGGVIIPPPAFDPTAKARRRKMRVLSNRAHGRA